MGDARDPFGTVEIGDQEDPKTLGQAAMQSGVAKLCMEANYEPGAGHAARLRPGADDRALRRRPAGAADPEGQRASWRGPRRSRTARTPASWCASSSSARTCTYGRGALRRDQRGRPPGLHRGLSASVHRALAVRSGEHGRQHAGRDPRRRGRARLKIQIMAKGGGCENRSKYKMLTPAAGVEGVKALVIECVKTAGPDACPPLSCGRRGRRHVREGGPPVEEGAVPRAGLAEPRSRRRRAGEGAARARQPARHRPPGLRRRHDRVRHPHPVPVPHHVAPGRGDHRVPRPPAQGGGAVTVDRERPTGSRSEPRR